MNNKQIFVIAIITMFLLVPFASAKQEVADNTKQDKKIDEKITDKTKESAKEISNKDKDIKGKVTVTDSDSSTYEVTRDGANAIKIKKNEASGQHTKAKVTIPKEELQKIDDGDGKFGYLRIGDNGEILDHQTLTQSQLENGYDMTFSETIVSGYIGYYEKTQIGVTTGTTIDIPDVSGNYYITTSVNGSIPSYVVGKPTSGLLAYYPLNGTANDYSGNARHGTANNVTWSNGSAFFKGVKSNITLPASVRPTGNYSIVITADPISDTMYNQMISFGYSYANKQGLSLTLPNTGTRLLSETGNGTAMYSTAIITSVIDRHTYGVARNIDTTRAVYKDSTSISTASSVKGTISYAGGTKIGESSWGNLQGFYGQLSEVRIYNRTISNAEYLQCYSGASGISMRPSPSYTFTGYNVASGVEKIIDTDATCTGVEYIDTTGGTHTVTVRIYFTEDITKTTETKGATHQNVSIVHTKQNATASVGSIAYELEPLYSGTPVLSSNNTNATVTRNDTHVLISTGLVKQGQSFSYAVSVADDHDHGIHLNQLMKWVGTGWDFVSTAPDDWTDYIGDEIEVIVS